MKRLLILFTLFTYIAGGTYLFSNNNVTAKDSLLKILSTLPADTSRLNTLYSLAHLEPMSPSCIYYLGKMLEEATKQNNKEYQCRAMYAHVVYYFNHQDEKNTVVWMDKLSKVALENKFYNTYFAGKRAEITIHIIKRKIEYSITEAEEMYKLAHKLGNVEGMSAAKLCLMTAYLMSVRYKEGYDAGFESYHLLPPTASLETRTDVLQEIALSYSSTNNKELLKYLQEFEYILNKLSLKNNKIRSYRGSYLLLEGLYADYYLKTGNMDEARKHLKEMDKYFTPTSYIPSRGLYYYVYSQYYRMTKEYDKSLDYSETAIKLLSTVSDNGGLNYEIERANILTDAGRLDEAIPLYQELLAKKDSFYRDLSTSQMEEIHQMRNMDNLLFEKEQNKTIVHYIMLALIAIALLILIPSTIRIYCVRKRLKKEEEEIRKMTLIAEEANDVKSRFLTNMSYNIRIPLNNVLGFSQLMTVDPESVDAAQWKEYSEIVQTNSAELIQLVNDVLDLSRLEADRTKWQMQDYDMIQLCTDIVNMAQMQDGNIQVEFHTEIKSQPIQVDVSRFTQMLHSTLIYSESCEEKRTVSLFLNRDEDKGELIFRIENSPLADPKLQTQKVEVRHSINRLTIAHFGGTYVIKPNTEEGPTILFTYPYSK
ncbi:sensor histidine kinase [Bacteroides sp.]